MKLSCCSTMVPGASLTEKAEKLKKWGYDGMALFVDYEAWTTELFDEIRHIEENTGIVPCEFVFGDAVYGHLMDEEHTVRDSCRAMYRTAAEICAEIGAVTELEYSYGTQRSLPLFSPYQKMNKNQRAEFLDVYRELLKPLEGTKGRLLLENINRYESPFLNSVQDCLDVLDELNHENAGLLMDFFHMSIEERSLPETIRKAGDKIAYIHLGDSNRLLPGAGHTDWKACFGELKKIGYSGFLNLECCPGNDPEISLPLTARFLRGIMSDE